jgi:hypothetical protein
MCTAIARYARQNSRPYSDIATRPRCRTAFHLPSHNTVAPSSANVRPSPTRRPPRPAPTVEQRGELSASVELRGLFPGIARRGKGERQQWRSDAGFDSVKQFIPLQPLLSHLFSAPRG